MAKPPTPNFVKITAKYRRHLQCWVNVWYLPSRALVKKCISGGLLEAAGQIRRGHPQQPGQRWQIFLPRKKLIIRSTTQTEIGHISYFTRRYLNEVGAKYCYCRNNDPVDKKLLDFCNLASFDLPELLLWGGTDASDGKIKCHPLVYREKSILPFFSKMSTKEGKLNCTCNDQNSGGPLWCKMLDWLLLLETFRASPVAFTSQYPCVEVDFHLIERYAGGRWWYLCFAQVGSVGTRPR